MSFDKKVSILMWSLIAIVWIFGAMVLFGASCGGDADYENEKWQCRRTCISSCDDDACYKLCAKECLRSCGDGGLDLGE